MPWTIEILPEADAEIKALPADMQARFSFIVDLLYTFGPQGVREPYVKPLGDKLWEMRMRGRDGIARAIYFAATGRRLVVVHAFVKKTQKTPPGAIALALKRIKEVRS